MLAIEDVFRMICLSGKLTIYELTKCKPSCFVKPRWHQFRAVIERMRLCRLRRQRRKVGRCEFPSERVNSMVQRALKCVELLDLRHFGE